MQRYSLFDIERMEHIATRINKRESVGVSRRIGIYLSALLCLVLAMLAALTFFYTQKPAEDAAIPDAPPNLELGQPAPAFQLQTVSGEKVSLSQMQGRPFWLSFWSTSCAPCQEQLPDLVTVSREVEADGISLLLVNAGDQPDVVRAYLQHTGYGALPVVLDPDFAATAAYNIYYMPSHVFVGTDGKIRRVETRQLTASGMRDALKSLR